MGYVSSQDGRSFSGKLPLPKLGVIFFWGEAFCSCSEVSTENRNGNVEIFQTLFAGPYFLRTWGHVSTWELSLGLDEGDWKSEATKKKTTVCWLFSKSGQPIDRLVFPIMYTFLYIPGGCLGFLPSTAPNVWWCLFVHSVSSSFTKTSIPIKKLEDENAEKKTPFSKLAISTWKSTCFNHGLELQQKTDGLFNFVIPKFPKQDFRSPFFQVISGLNRGGWMFFFDKSHGPDSCMVLLTPWDWCIYLRICTIQIDQT